MYGCGEVEVDGWNGLRLKLAFPFGATRGVSAPILRLPKDLDLDHGLYLFMKSMHHGG